MLVGEVRDFERLCGHLQITFVIKLNYLLAGAQVLEGIFYVSENLLLGGLLLELRLAECILGTAISP
jgi:hypothetical protein